MPHVFISYARREPHWATKLDRDLKARGYDTWRDVRNINPDQDFTGEIEVGIKNATHVVVCLTPDVRREDSFVRRELQYALNNDAQRKAKKPSSNLPLIPVVFPGGELPVHISTWTALFLYDEAKYEKLLGELINRLENPIDTQEQPQYFDPPEVVRYLHDLHDWCSERLQNSVAYLLTIGAKTTTGIVNPIRKDRFQASFCVSPATALSNKVTPDSRTFFSLKDAINYHGKRLILLGAPGSGKTTTLLAFAREAAVERLSDSSKPIPILGSIHLWDQKSDLKSWITGISPKFAQIIQQPLYLLDGLDELGGPQTVEHTRQKNTTYDPRRNFIEALARDLPREAVVITCREEDFREIGQRAPLDAAITLKSLSDSQIGRYLKARGQHLLWKRVKNDPDFSRLVRTPLLLGMLSIAIGDDASNFTENVTPLDEGFIFDRYITRRFLHESARPGEMEYTELQTRNWLATISTYMWIESDPPNTLSGRWLVLQRPNLVRQKFEQLLGTEAQPFVDFCTRMHLLRTDRDGAIAFLHLKLRDFCALPALYEMADWRNTESHLPVDNPVWIDVSSYPSNFDWPRVTHALSNAALYALSVIGREGIDLVRWYRFFHPGEKVLVANERRQHYISKPNISIPDNHPEGVRDTIQIQDTGRVSEISIRLNIHHTYVGDLRVLLHPPDGSVCPLFDRSGGREGIFGVRSSVFDSVIARLRNLPCKGNWTLEISDHAEGDVGLLESWELDIRMRP